MYFFFFFFFLCLSLFVSLSVSFFWWPALMGFGGRPVLVTSQCSLRSLANKLRLFVHSAYEIITI